MFYSKSPEEILFAETSPVVLADSISCFLSTASTFLGIAIAFLFFQAEGRTGQQSFCAMGTDRAQPVAYGQH